jgi:hypothetical protein
VAGNLGPAAGLLSPLSRGEQEECLGVLWLATALKAKASFRTPKQGGSSVPSFLKGAPGWIAFNQLRWPYSLLVARTDKWEEQRRRVRSQAWSYLFTGL